jgi:glutamine cyclotransferase
MGLVVAALVLALALPVYAEAPPATPHYGYRIKNRYPHDPAAFTQGLVYHNGVLLESTGGFGESTLREVDLETGRVLRALRLPREIFGEGLALWRNQLVQLSWRNGIGFVYDRDTLQFKKRFSYETEGWGLAQDGASLILSDGSATLYFLDPESFSVRRRVEVRAQGKPVRSLNELEYVNGEILANVWHTDRIARIAPDTGEVRGWIDLGGLRGPREQRDPEAVLNGIAYDAEHSRLFVTGKRWATLYEIELVPPQ